MRDTQIIGCIQVPLTSYRCKPLYARPAMTMLSLEGRALPTCCIALRARKHFLWWHQGTLGGHFSDHELRKEHTIYTRKPVLHKYYLSIYNSSSVYCEEPSYGACFNVEPSHYIRVLTGPCSVIQQCILYWLEPGDMFNSFPLCVCLYASSKQIGLVPGCCRYLFREQADVWSALPVLQYNLFELPVPRSS